VPIRQGIVICGTAPVKESSEAFSWHPPPLCALIAPRVLAGILREDPPRAPADRRTQLTVREKGWLSFLVLASNFAAASK